MIDQTNNPMFHHCQGDLPPSGNYPAAWIDIFWNTTDDELRAVKDVEIILFPRGSEAMDTCPSTVRSEYSSYIRQWTSSAGNSCAGWMEPGGLTPANVFGSLLATGFASQEDLIRAIDEFAGVEECGWAREMQAAIQR